MLNTSLAQMRRLGQQYLLGEYELLDATRSLDKYGRETLTYSVAATLKGQLSQVSGQERKLLTAIVGSGIERLETGRLALPWGTAASADQYVRRKGTSKVWNIRHVATDEDLGAYVVALLTREVTDVE